MGVYFTGRVNSKAEQILIDAGVQAKGRHHSSHSANIPTVLPHRTDDGFDRGSDCARGQRCMLPWIGIDECCDVVPAANRGKIVVAAHLADDMTPIPWQNLVSDCGTFTLYRCLSVVRTTARTSPIPGIYQDGLKNCIPEHSEPLVPLAEVTSAGVERDRTSDM